MLLVHLIKSLEGQLEGEDLVECNFCALWLIVI